MEISHTSSQKFKILLNVLYFTNISTCFRMYSVINFTFKKWQQNLDRNVNIVSYCTQFFFVCKLIAYFEESTKYKKINPNFVYPQLLAKFYEPINILQLSFSENVHFSISHLQKKKADIQTKCKCNFMKFLNCMPQK